MGNNSTTGTAKLPTLTKLADGFGSKVNPTRHLGGALDSPQFHGSPASCKSKELSVDEIVDFILYLL